MDAQRKENFLIQKLPLARLNSGELVTTLSIYSVVGSSSDKTSQWQKYFQEICYWFLISKDKYMAFNLYSHLCGRWGWVERETGTEKMNKWRWGMYGNKGMYVCSMGMEEVWTQGRQGAATPPPTQRRTPACNKQLWEYTSKQTVEKSQRNATNVMYAWGQ